MPINFHDPENKQMYTERNVDPAWTEMMKSLLEPHRTACALDIGCGGGIYTRELRDMGVENVIGIDFSEQMIKAAEHYCRDVDGISFHVGTADNTKMEDGTADLILQRAVIHHLDDLAGCFTEASRLLKKGGLLVLQDRTPEDCLLPGSPEHIRGYFFSEFPHLAKLEIQRRHTSQAVITELSQAGFSSIKEKKLWETRRIYSSAEELQLDLSSRTGRSILHDLTDSELTKLINHIILQLDNGKEEIIEQDRWTIWVARKPI